ncbi:hypothetical protein MRX96_043246 [Rhipicephalus microplus]
MRPTLAVLLRCKLTAVPVFPFPRSGRSSCSPDGCRGSLSALAQSSALLLENSYELGGGIAIKLNYETPAPMTDRPSCASSLGACLRFPALFEVSMPFPPNYSPGFLRFPFFSPNPCLRSLALLGRQVFRSRGVQYFFGAH